MKDESHQNTTRWLILAITGTFLIMASVPYICWGVQMRFHYIPLLEEFPVYGDNLETVADIMSISSLVLLIGASLLALGLLQYLRYKT